MSTREYPSRRQLTRMVQCAWSGPIACPPVKLRASRLDQAMAATQLLQNSVLSQLAPDPGPDPGPLAQVPGRRVGLHRGAQPLRHRPRHAARQGGGGAMQGPGRCAHGPLPAGGGKTRSRVRWVGGEVVLRGQMMDALTNCFLHVEDIISQGSNSIVYRYITFLY